jgi:hypothetical protein
MGERTSASLQFAKHIKEAHASELHRQVARWSSRHLTVANLDKTKNGKHGLLFLSKRKAFRGMETLSRAWRRFVTARKRISMQVFDEMFAAKM